MYILKEDNQNDIIFIPNFLSDIEIDEIFNLCKNKEFIDAEVNGNKFIEERSKNFLSNHKIKNLNKGGIVKRIRETNLKWIYLDEQSKWLFKKIIQCINTVNANNYNYILKFVEDLQFTEYTSQNKGFYSKHNDCGNKYDLKNFVDIRKLSFSIQLSDPNEYEGGELRFYTGKKSIYNNKEECNVAKKDKGSIIFFPSYMVHEITSVTKGIRYSLVSWVNGPNLL